MCGHTYHNRCIVSLNKANRSCLRCHENDEDMRKAVETNQKDALEVANTDKFDKRLNKNQNKFNTIAQYLERGMIKDFQPEELNV